MISSKDPKSGDIIYVMWENGHGYQAQIVTEAKLRRGAMWITIRPFRAFSLEKGWQTMDEYYRSRSIKPSETFSVRLTDCLTTEEAAVTKAHLAQEKKLRDRINDISYATQQLEYAKQNLSRCQQLLNDVKNKDVAALFRGEQGKESYVSPFTGQVQ